MAKKRMRPLSGKQKAAMYAAKDDSPLDKAAMRARAKMKGKK